MRVLEHISIYSDEAYYSAFPSIVARPDGELLVAFRRAPDRRRFFAARHTHTDPNSHLVLVRSHDQGRTWTREPELIYAHPFGGSQDPCMVQLRDGSLLVSSYAWMLLSQDGVSQAAAEPRWQVYGWPFTFLGGYLMRSTDGGRSWQGPIIPPEGDGQAHYFPGVPIPACNRGAMVEASDGNLYWLVQRSLQSRPRHTLLGLLVSKDGGLTWEDRGIAVADEQVIFNETSLIQTPRGDLVAFIRTDRFADHGAVARSTDLGRTWEPWQDMDVIGHPYHAVQLPDGRVFLVYGYRHPPFGIRARLLDPECCRFDTPELVLRDDGGGTDLGYPWACALPDGRVLAVYYFNQADGVRHIAGTFIEVD
ncbi:MAG: exo-alpha-sialidase [Chloroflexi bacterium]|nr:exo-alpha-sialidase [Chloroflexota bacterium]